LKAKSDFNRLGHGGLFDLAHDEATSTDSYPLSLSMMRRHRNEGKIIPIKDQDGNYRFHQLNHCGRTTKTNPKTGEEITLTDNDLLNKQIKSVEAFNKDLGLDLDLPYMQKGIIYVPSVVYRKYKNGGQIASYKDGGEVKEDNKVNISRQATLDRSNSVVSNYSDAKDFNLNPLVYSARKWLKDNFGRGGISNCTLSATSWVDPNNQYMSAKNIIGNPNSGYIEIDKDYALPGDLLISKNPSKENSYHTMLIESFDKDEPILRYSRGGHDTTENLVQGRTLTEYHKLDNEQGGNHTEDHYFRYNYPNEYWLPEIIVTAEKYQDGGEVNPYSRVNPYTGKPLSTGTVDPVLSLYDAPLIGDAMS
jgi:hypothetical protein